MPHFVAQHYEAIMTAIGVALIIIGGPHGLRLVKYLRGENPIAEERNELHETVDVLKREKAEWMVNKEFLFNEAASARIIRDRSKESLELCRTALKEAEGTIARMKAVVAPTHE